LTTFDREWQDGDDSALYEEGYDAGYKQAIVDSQKSEKRLGALSAHADDLRLMFFDLDEALREELEVHDEPSRHLLEAVGSWALRLHLLGLLTDEDKKHYFDMTNMEEDDDE